MNSRLRGFEICKGFEDTGLTLPQRATKNSAGYDFRAAEDVTIPPTFCCIQLSGRSVLPLEKPVLVKTGIRAYMQPNEVLIIANRSGGPMKRNLVLANSIGVVDEDYYCNKNNDGHVMFCFYNFGEFPINIIKGEAIGQGYFAPFLKADDDEGNNVERQGGFNSTGN